ncbi:WD40-repeat-containing domain protein [Cladorrhinum sp. PSN332]|nr:WD40-repeat-containing domain protein [Cladorrhinum sp. PSN332]
MPEDLRRTIARSNLQKDAGKSKPFGANRNRPEPRYPVIIGQDTIFKTAKKLAKFLNITPIDSLTETKAAVIDLKTWDYTNRANNKEPTDIEKPYLRSVRAIAAHGDTLVSGSYDSTVRVWRISTGAQLHNLQGHTQKVSSVVLDRKRNHCISGSTDSLVKIWDLATGACLQTLWGHGLSVSSLNLRDETLVSASADSIIIWDPETGEMKKTLITDPSAITCFQHDGAKVVSGSEKTVKMWDTQTGVWVKDLLTDLSGVWQVKFDDRRCVAAVQRGNLNYIEILDFGAVRDGMAPELLGKRRLLDETEVELRLRVDE